MELGRIDLNLLVILDVLLTERNVTRAAEKLGMSQPAMSGALQRLRDLFVDPLLVRSGREMEPTPLAQCLAGPLREALLTLRTAIAVRPQFEPGQVAQTFRVMMSDYCMCVLLPLVIRRVLAEAPNVSIVVETFGRSAPEVLRSGEIDLCVARNDLEVIPVYGFMDKFHSEELFDEEFIIVVATDHPLGKSITAEDYRQLSHVQTNFVKAGPVLTARQEEGSGRIYKPEHHTTVTVPSFNSLPFLLKDTKLIGLVQRRLLELFGCVAGIRQVKASFSLPVLHETMIWHARTEDDPAQRWLRSIFRKAAVELRKDNDETGAVGRRTIA